MDAIDARSVAADRLVEFWTAEADRDAVGRYRHDRRRHQSLTARALLRRLLTRETGVASRLWRIGSDARGKPFVDTRGGAPPIAISIAHSRDVAVCAITDLGPIGIDIEGRDTSRNVQGMAAAAFGAGEQQAVAQGGSDAFYRIWVLREAFAKATGAGFEMAVDRVDRFASIQAGGAWKQRIAGQGWWFACGEVKGNYVLGVAISLGSGRHPPFAPRLARPSGGGPHETLGAVLSKSLGIVSCADHHRMGDQ